MALPESDPAPILISLVKSFSDRDLVTINKIDVKESSARDEINKGNLVLDAEVEKNSLDFVNFIQSLMEAVPISGVTSVDIDNRRDAVELTIQSSYYWSAFPTELPAVNEPIKDLSKDERELLSRISNYVKPKFGELQPNGYSRENPFY